MKFLNLSVGSDYTSFSCEFNQNIMLTFTLNNGKNSQLEVFTKEEEGGFGKPLFRKNYKYIPNLETIVTDIQNTIASEGKKYWITVGKIEGLTAALNQINRTAVRNPISDHLSILRSELAEDRRRLIKEVKRNDANSRSS